MHPMSLCHRTTACAAWPVGGVGKYVCWVLQESRVTARHRSQQKHHSQQKPMHPMNVPAVSQNHRMRCLACGETVLMDRIDKFLAHMNGKTRNGRRGRLPSAAAAAAARGDGFRLPRTCIVPAWDELLTTAAQPEATNPGAWQHGSPALHAAAVSGGAWHDVSPALHDGSPASAACSPSWDLLLHPEDEFDDPLSSVITVAADRSNYDDGPAAGGIIAAASAVQPPLPHPAAGVHVHRPLSRHPADQV